MRKELIEMGMTTPTKVLAGMWLLQIAGLFLMLFVFEGGSYLHGTTVWFTAMLQGALLALIANNFARDWRQFLKELRDND